MQTGGGGSADSFVEKDITVTQTSYLSRMLLSWNALLSKLSPSAFHHKHSKKWTEYMEWKI